MTRSRKDARGGHHPRPGVAYDFRAIDAGVAHDGYAEVYGPRSKRFWKCFKQRKIRGQEQHHINQQSED